jgi:hypothetical protein
MVEDSTLSASHIIDKRWHVVHYLVTGDAEGGEYPLGHAILGGYISHGSGEATSFLPADIVKDVAEGLNTLSISPCSRLALSISLTMFWYSITRFLESLVKSSGRTKSTI